MSKKPFGKRKQIPLPNDGILAEGKRFKIAMSYRAIKAISAITFSFCGMTAYILSSDEVTANALRIIAALGLRGSIE